jgi:hypothetical protein
MLVLLTVDDAPKKTTYRRDRDADGPPDNSVMMQGKARGCFSTGEEV